MTAIVTNISKIYITIRKLSGIIIESKQCKTQNTILASSLNKEMIRLGFTMSESLFNRILHLSKSNIRKLHEKVMPVLRYIKGADVDYVPLFPNFPDDILTSLQANAHAGTMLGYWQTNIAPEPRSFGLEIPKFYQLELITPEDFKGLFATLLSSNDSLSQEDNDIVKWYINNIEHLEIDAIPYKETMCIVAGMLIEKGESIIQIVHTATDVLRIATYLSGGDISLASNTKFKSLPRKLRRELVEVLNSVIAEEDIKRHKNKWKRLFHNLHVGKYAAPKLFQIVRKVRNNYPLYSVMGEAQRLIDNNKLTEVSELLTKRPGEFARRLDHLLRIANCIEEEDIIDNFIQCIDKISTRVLMQLHGHFNNRNENSKRVVFPKGNIQKAIMINPIEFDLHEIIINQILSGIDDELTKRFSLLEPLGNTYIDSRLIKCPLPSQQRSSSIGFDIVARGTHLPFGNKNTLRFFIYWIGRDIDLSATFHDVNFIEQSHVSYTKLQNGYAVHSGDVTNAPDGASEFIDIDIHDALSRDIRYVVMNVLVYSGENFSDHKKCYAGWMTRSLPQSNEIYEPRTVENKIDITTNTKNIIPMVFDLESREMIWCDIIPSRRRKKIPNNVENNQASIEQVLQSIISLNGRPTLYNLMLIHAQARGVVINDDNEIIKDMNPKDMVESDVIDTVFSLNYGITPRDINLINSEYLV